HLEVASLGDARDQGNRPAGGDGRGRPGAGIPGKQGGNTGRGLAKGKGQSESCLEESQSGQVGR
ncbi:MAG: hypothetical protein QMD10_12735, partial [Desulfitobacteriaceae bacterium]|nr:hypothetical protein [Desulfitobacteriaceae bacterium]